MLQQLSHLHRGCQLHVIPKALAAGCHGDHFSLLVLLRYPMVGEVQGGMRKYIRPALLPRSQISNAELNDMHS